MTAMCFVPYAEAADLPNIVVDGAAAAATVLTLSHWPKSGTPETLRADTSAEIVFSTWMRRACMWTAAPPRTITSTRMA